MSPEELKARARRVVEEILNQGDLAVANELISPDCVHHVPGSQPKPGLAGLMGWLALTQRIFPDFHAIVEDEIAEGDRVVQRITCYGTHQGEFCGVLPTGEQVAFSSIEINRAGADGKFAEHWSSADLLGVLHRLRLAAAPSPISAAEGMAPA
jgi:predicted ester cyclase